MSLADLPDELLLCIADWFEKLNDINSLSRVTRRLHDVLNRPLYRANVIRRGSDVLLWAAERGLLKTTQMLLNEGANCEVQSSGRLNSNDRYTPYTGRGGTILDFMFSPLWWQSWVINLLTPLQLAICCQHEAVALLLIEAGANINKRYPRPMLECSMLHLASFAGLTTTVRTLISKGADPRVCDDQRRTPLHYAVQSSKCRARTKAHVDTVLLLLENGVKFQARDKSGRTAENCLKQPVTWSEQPFEDGESDAKAERKIQQIIEAKHALKVIDKLDKERELSIKRRQNAEKQEQQRLQEKRELRRSKRLAQIEAELVFKTQQGIDQGSNVLLKPVKATNTVDEPTTNKQDTLIAAWSRMRLDADHRSQIPSLHYSLQSEDAVQPTGTSEVKNERTIKSLKKKWQPLQL